MEGRGKRLESAGAGRLLKLGSSARYYIIKLFSHNTAGALLPSTSEDYPKSAHPSFVYLFFCLLLLTYFYVVFLPVHFPAIYSPPHVHFS